MQPQIRYFDIKNRFNFFNLYKINMGAYVETWMIFFLFHR